MYAAKHTTHLIYVQVKKEGTSHAVRMCMPHPFEVFQTAIRKVQSAVFIGCLLLHHDFLSTDSSISQCRCLDVEAM